MARSGLISNVLPHFPLAIAAENVVTMAQGAGWLLVVREPSLLHNNALSSVTILSEEESS